VISSTFNRCGASMTYLTTEQLQNIQAKADSMLDAIIERLEGSTQLQAALRHVMQAGDDVLARV